MDVRMRLVELVYQRIQRFLLGLALPVPELQLDYLSGGWLGCCRWGLRRCCRLGTGREHQGDK